MKNMKKKTFILLAILIVSLSAIAWASVKITGGGYLINSSNGQSVATLTLSAMPKLRQHQLFSFG